MAAMAAVGDAAGLPERIRQLDVFIAGGPACPLIKHSNYECR
jgi:hypothetical protein